MGSFHVPTNFPSSAVTETSCDYLLQELKLIWDEVGQDQLERERVLFDLEQECLEVYKKKVDSANVSRVRLHQALADSEAELTNILLSLGERSFPGRPEKLTGSLKAQLDAITPALREMQLRKEERVNQFREVQTQIQRISLEIAGHSETDGVVLNESDLSLKKLEDYQTELQQLQNEKSDRLLHVEEYINELHELAGTMGMDSSKIINDVHPSLDGSSGKQTKNISDNILNRLKSTVELLKEEKQKRMQKLHKLGKALTNLWNLMDTSFTERKPFADITTYASTTSTGKKSAPGSLTYDIIHQVESEVERLDQLKASKMKELFLKKQIELEEICKKSHMEIPSKPEMDDTMNLIVSGEMDHAELLATMEEHMSKARKEASSRKDIMEKVDKWMTSRSEECWLEEYSRDQNRYSVSRGAHKNLIRAERARIKVNKIPALVESLVIETTAWEDERHKVFQYDQVPLLAMLEEYTSVRKEKEEEKYRQRDRKKVQTQIVTVQERAFGSRPSTSTSSHYLSDRSLNSSSNTCLNRRLSSMTQKIGSNKASVKGSNLKERNKKLAPKMLPQKYSVQIGADTASDVYMAFSGRQSVL